MVIFATWWTFSQNPCQVLWYYNLSLQKRCPIISNTKHFYSYTWRLHVIIKCYFTFIKDDIVKSPMWLWFLWIKFVLNMHCYMKPISYYHTINKYRIVYRAVSIGSIQGDAMKGSESKLMMSTQINWFRIKGRILQTHENQPLMSKSSMLQYRLESIFQDTLPSLQMNLKYWILPNQYTNSVTATMVIIWQCTKQTALLYFSIQHMRSWLYNPYYLHLISYTL